MSKNYKIIAIVGLLLAAAAFAWWWFTRPSGEAYFFDTRQVEGYEALDTVTSTSWIMIDGATGMVLAQRDCQRQMYPASMTKMMTCILAIESGRLRDTITIAGNEADVMSTRVREGDSYVMRDLLDEMMLNSDNGAALAIARYIGEGDTLRFYRQMNDKAAFIGMRNTHFANPHGLPDSLNYSTATDMAMLAQYCMDDTVFANIVATIERDVPLTDGRKQESHNSNLLLERYEGCHGIKTGFTNLAGGCLASVATRNGRTIFLVVMHCSPAWKRIPNSADLLDYGFNLLTAPYVSFHYVRPMCYYPLPWQPTVFLR